MVKKIILVGSTTQNNKFVNGQSMMFQLFVDHLKEKNVQTVIVDFGKSIDKNFASKRVSGKFNFIKLIDNFLLIFRFTFVLLTNLKTPIYITTSQSKVGFVRDYILIGLGKFFGSTIIAHQFGANYNRFYENQSAATQKKINSTLEKADKVIVEGDFTKRQFSFLKDFEQKVIVIPNGLPEKVKSATVLPKILNPNEPTQLLYLSNLIESKGFWDVLEAVNLLVNRDKKNIKVIFSGFFLGDVEDQRFPTSERAKKEFFNFIKQNNLSDHITYFEGLYGSDKVEAFTKSNFFLLPSYYVNEGQPVSVLEALAYGCVPIVTKYRLIPDMVNTENGFFVPAKSPEDISRVILEMIANPTQYTAKSKAGIQFYLDNFTADKYIGKVLDLF